MISPDAYEQLQVDAMNEILGEGALDLLEQFTRKMPEFATAIEDAISYANQNPRAEQSELMAAAKTSELPGVAFSLLEKAFEAKRVVDQKLGRTKEKAPGFCGP